MDDPCLEDRELLSLLHAAIDDPRWRHVRGCPRCRGNLAAYRRYVALTVHRPGSGEGDRPGHSREDEVVGRLQRGMREEILGEPVRPGIKDRVRSMLLPRRWVPALGAAAVVAGAALLLTDLVPRWPAGPGSSRDDSPPEGEATIESRGERRLPDGSLELRWRPLPGARAYRVRLLGTGLEAMAVLPATTESTAVLPAAGPDGHPISAAWWQVEALESGDRVADSRPRPLP